MTDPFYPIATELLLDATGENEEGYFKVHDSYSGLLASRFRFEHLNGTVNCDLDPEYSNYWGCSQYGFIINFHFLFLTLL